jgi:tRNA(adenine34) deaminase
MDDHDYMGAALAQAEEAFARGDWPVGAVLVNHGMVLALGQNRQNTLCDMTVHAETDALRRAQAAHGLPAIAGSTLYCTMEPCPMCAWALKIAGVRRPVLGLRHATLDRIDMGGYSIEAFCGMVGFDTLELTTDVRLDECLEIRRRWGKDQVRAAPPSEGDDTVR